jgi:hypothetical protein
MPSPLLALVPSLIVGVIGWVNPVPIFCLFFFHSYNLPVSSLVFIVLRFVSVQSLLSCVSCQCNKSHKLSFNVTFLMSHAPLEYLYIDVWGQSLRFHLLMATSITVTG